MMELGNEIQRFIEMPDGIITARTRSTTYGDILKAVIKKDALQKLGESVTHIRKTAKGEILMELKSAQMESTADYIIEIGLVTNSCLVTKQELKQ